MVTVIWHKAVSLARTDRCGLAPMYTASSTLFHLIHCSCQLAIASGCLIGSVVFAQAQRHARNVRRLVRQSRYRSVCVCVCVSMVGRWSAFAGAPSRCLTMQRSSPSPPASPTTTRNYHYSLLLMRPTDSSVALVFYSPTTTCSWRMMCSLLQVS